MARKAASTSGSRNMPWTNALNRSIGAGGRYFMGFQNGTPGTAGSGRSGSGGAGKSGS